VRSNKSGDKSDGNALEIDTKLIDCHIATQKMLADTAKGAQKRSANPITCLRRYWCGLRRCHRRHHRAPILCVHEPLSSVGDQRCCSCRIHLYRHDYPVAGAGHLPVLVVTAARPFGRPSPVRGSVGRWIVPARTPITAAPPGRG